MKTEEKTESNILNILDDYAMAYEKKDLDAIFDLFAPDPELTFIGTDVNERCRGLEEVKNLIRRDFEMIQDLSWEWKNRNITESGSVAWLSADCFAKAKIRGEEISLPMRITAVLKHYDDKWRIAQWHGSVPVMREL